MYVPLSPPKKISSCETRCLGSNPKGLTSDFAFLASNSRSNSSSASGLCSCTQRGHPRINPMLIPVRRRDTTPSIINFLTGKQGINTMVDGYLFSVIILCEPTNIYIPTLSVPLSHPPTHTHTNSPRELLRSVCAT